MALSTEWLREPLDVLPAAQVVALQIAGVPTKHARFELRLGQAGPKRHNEGHRPGTQPRTGKFSEPVGRALFALALMAPEAIGVFF